jgi:hypothetical protein
MTRIGRPNWAVDWASRSSICRRHPLPTATLILISERSLVHLQICYLPLLAHIFPLRLTLLFMKTPMKNHRPHSKPRRLPLHLPPNHILASPTNPHRLIRIWWLQGKHQLRIDQMWGLVDYVKNCAMVPNNFCKLHSTIRFNAVY